MPARIQLINHRHPFVLTGKRVQVDARHRKRTQGLLDLKRLSWNCHTFRTGRRKGQSPYQRLGLKLPEGMGWWERTKMTPEQLRDKLSALKAVI